MKNGVKSRKPKGFPNLWLTKNSRMNCTWTVFFSDEMERHQMRSIRSENHNLYLKSINKISLSPFDDKRYWLAPHGVESYSYGHFKIMNE